MALSGQGGTALPRSSRRSRRACLTGVLVALALLVLVLCISVPVLWTNYGLYQMDAASMEPGLAEGDRVMVNRSAYRSNGPQRGDIIVFSLEGLGGLQIKRVIGLPGETVRINDQVVYINDAPLDEPYASELPELAYSPNQTIPEDSYFVLGDNRSHSADSRSFGPISRSAIIGQVVWIVSPPERRGPAPNYHLEPNP